MKSRDIFVVIPVYNEVRNVKMCLNQVREVWSRIIVVNDGSTDRTGEVVKEFGKEITLVELPQNKGKGAAMRAGAETAWKMGAKAVIFMDGDNQHDPKHIAEFVRVLKRGYKAAVGVRILKTDIPLIRKIGNWLMAKMMGGLFAIDLPDMMCGYRALTKETFEQLPLTTNRYGVEVEMLVLLTGRQVKYQTLVVDTIYHDKYKGFSIVDGLKILLSLPYYKWRIL